MDFCQLLHKAQKNDKTTSSRARYYSTKYEPPKKVKKESKDLSANIKKFLAKKEAEEQQKREQDQRKKEDLLALRAQDKKATRRVNVMLKRTKSANQSVIEDAVDNTHTAVTRAGPDQPDEDDYGYVSQEATALYEKMMEKYSQMPEEPKFDMFKKKVSTNLNSTKDRVKAALEREREEAMMPHKRKRKKKHEDGQEGEEKKEDNDRSSPDSSKDFLNDSKEKEVPKPKPKPRPPAPPPLSFTELLKIAAQKQHEPILIEEKPQEEEKLYTKRQKKELEKEREWRERRERRLNEMENRDRDEKDKGRSSSSSSSKPIPKLAASNSESKILERQLTKPNPSEKTSEKPQIKDRDRFTSYKNPEKDRIPSKPSSSGYKTAGEPFKKPLPVDSKSSKLSSGNSALRDEDYRKSGSSKPLKSGKNSDHGLTPSKSSNTKREEITIKKGAPSQGVSGKFGGKPKEFPPRDLLSKNKPKDFPPKDIKPKQFPPPDVRGVKRKQPIVANRGRIIDDDDEEYDSELDDFIDDGPEEGDYSSYIKEIFGYDKSRYRDVEDDDDIMETSFAQQMKEEVISTKIGIKEDLEDMKKEEEDKRRKALMKKKMKR